MSHGWIKAAYRIALGEAAAYGLWWFLAHGRTSHPGLARLRGFRYAHRGLHDGTIPENSLTAFRRAVEHGCGAELDVRLTKDGRLAVMHDSSLKRMCGLDARVENMTTEQLRELTLLDSDEPIPFLEDVLPLFESTTALVVEIKPSRGNHPALTAATMECLDRHQLAYCVESFDPRVLAWLRIHRPDVVRGQLTENFFRDRASHLPTLLRLLLTHLLGNVAARPDFIAEKFEDRRGWSHRLCCERWGVQGAYWTIRSPEDQAIAEADDHMVIFEGYMPGDDKP
ncbi:MAG: hypothetical protein LBV00_05700 [Propionibacteriaceae bacterium]|jgi:glycerophosphoryl diester phosphodiesterase|nr:hypothetical protein [Propionibacteriaceae bacterium]